MAATLPTQAEPDPASQLPSYTAEEQALILRNDEGIPVSVTDKKPWTPLKIIVWALIALAGAAGWTALAISRGERVNTVWFVVVAVCTFAIAYRFYALYIEKRLMRPNDRNAVPSERVNNGRDFDPTDRRILFGHHFAAIAGAGPLVGPVLAAQMGYLPGTLWIIVGVVFAGAVQDMLALFFSIRRGGRSLGQMARDEIGRVGGTVAMVILLLLGTFAVAVLALVVVNALAESPWGVVAVGSTIPIALIMGLYLRYFRPGRVLEVSVIGFVLLMGALVAGRQISQSSWAEHLMFSPVTLSWALMAYGFVAAILPVWLMLTPRDYLSTLMKVGTIFVLALGIVLVRPWSEIPALTEFASNTKGPAFAGTLFPFLFITIACGALSGMHAVIVSGTSPKMIQKESQTRLIGYGGMLLEAFVAVMAMAAAASINQGVYFSMNMSAGSIDTLAAPVIAAMSPEEAAALTPADKAAIAIGQLDVTNAAGEAVSIEWETAENGVVVTTTGAEALEQIARDCGEPSIISRTGGAPTLAVGMANILRQLLGGHSMMGFWYHFAILFEALFILTTIDACTRVGRFQVTDVLGNWFPKFKNPSWQPGAWLGTAAVVALWGSILLMGVTDPMGGIKSLFPMFGIANQLIAAIALSVITLMVIRKGYLRWAWVPGLPLIWDIAVTFTASYQKIFSADPALGYWKLWSVTRQAIASGSLEGQALANAQATLRNSAIQGTLSIVFVSVTAVVIVAAAVKAVQTIRTKDTTTSEDPFMPSRLFAPSHFLASRLERKVEKEYAAVGDPALLIGRRARDLKP
ncbi:MAG: carbon starvation protein A [Propionibacteriaceae bacterium]|nr:carbon starvation protein A [Propionibacteriaceae bacterium]